MDIIMIFNGLGNQMSQYALYLNKKEKQQNVMCITFNTGHNGFELERIFGIKIRKTPLYYIAKCIYIVLWFERWKHIDKILQGILKKIGINTVFEYGMYSVNDKIIAAPMGGVRFVHGGWHNPMYFDDIKDLIQSTYKFSIYDNKNKEIVKSAQKTDSVAVHVRGGDYLIDGLYDAYGSVCTEKYYHNAMAYIEAIIPDPTYYVFTNDVNLAKKLLDGKKYVLVTHNRGLDSWKDMALMSKFKNIIIPNSSFSWWAAYLGQKDKCVMRPPVFINGNKTSSEIYPKEWIKIDNI